MQNLFDIQRRTRFNVDEFCKKHNISKLWTVLPMLRDEPVRRDQAESVLKALSKDLGEHLTLDNVAVRLVEE
jgi:hypothetical protein